MICICSFETPPEVLHSLTESGFEICTLPRDPSLPTPVDFHTDLLIFILEDTLLTRKDYYELAKDQIDGICAKSGLTLSLSEAHARGTYPEDCGLCAAISGKNIICRIKSTDPELLRLAREKGYNPLNVPQGYAKCSCAILSDGATITSDKGIAKALFNAGIDVLLISSGSVELPGYDYGFIGGASGLCCDTLYFSGCIENHPDIAAISDFASKHGTKLVSLGKSKLYDIGSIYFLK